jgi:hypothetical protein
MIMRIDSVACVYFLRVLNEILTNPQRVAPEGPRAMPAVAASSLTDTETANINNDGHRAMQAL